MAMKTVERTLTEAQALGRQYAQQEIEDRLDRAHHEVTAFEACAVYEGQVGPALIAAALRHVAREVSSMGRGVITVESLEAKASHAEQLYQAVLEQAE